MLITAVGSNSQNGIITSLIFDTVVVDKEHEQKDDEKKYISKEITVSRAKLTIHVGYISKLISSKIKQCTVLHF